MNRREFMLTLFATALAGKCADAHDYVVTAAQDARRAADARPNIVLIVSDDQGYADSGCYSDGEVSTPSIDRIAAQGVLMTEGYASATVCSPSRAGLMTGRYQQRFGYYTQASQNPGLPLEEVTIAEILSDAGYATGLVGKWHLGGGRGRRPLDHGFDEFYGFLAGYHDYFDLRNVPGRRIFRDKKPVDETGYLTHNFTREAVAFIDKHKHEPFFLLLAYNAVHSPWQAPEDYLQRVTCADPQRRTYLAMLACMDDGIGEVLDKLKEVGVDDNTLVFFLSDNGGPSLDAYPPSRVAADNGRVLRGGKTQLWEGGIRVPFLVRWPAQLPAGQKCSVPCISLDILPTAVAAAGADLPKDVVIDGMNMLPLLRGESAGPLHDVLFWCAPAHRTWAVRRGNWKLVHADAETTLCDLATDPGERTNLAGDKPEVVEALTDAYKAWQAEMGDPSLAAGERRRLRSSKRGSSRTDSEPPQIPDASDRHPTGEVSREPGAQPAP